MVLADLLAAAADAEILSRPRGHPVDYAHSAQAPPLVHNRL